jgi:hypothetical protein
LADSELVMGFRFRMAMAQPKARLQAFDQNKWDRRLHYDKTDCRRKLDLFVALRRDNIALLRTATVRDWKQYGMHEERGKETLERMVQMDAGHDVNHLRQVRTLRERFLKGPSR